MWTDEDEVVYQRDREDAFLDFADRVQAGAEAIREARRLRVELAKAKTEIKELRKQAGSAVNTSTGIVMDMVMALSTGAMSITDDPVKRAEAAKMLDARYLARQGEGG